MVIVNTLLALLGAGSLLVELRAGHFNPALALAAAVWLSLGPMLLIRKSAIWRMSRPLIYAFALGLAVMVIFAITDGALLRNPVIIGLQILVVVYLIGLRGYLNGNPVRAYYRVP